MQGEKDAERLGIIQVRVRGQSEAVDVRRVQQNKKTELEGEKGTTENQDIWDRMDRVVEEF